MGLVIRIGLRLRFRAKFIPKFNGFFGRGLRLIFRPRFWDFAATSASEAAPVDQSWRTGLPPALAHWGHLPKHVCDPLGWTCKRKLLYWLLVSSCCWAMSLFWVAGTKHHLCSCRSFIITQNNLLSVWLCHVSIKRNFFLFPRKINQYYFGVDIVSDWLTFSLEWTLKTDDYPHPPQKIGLEKIAKNCSKFWRKAPPPPHRCIYSGSPPLTGGASIDCLPDFFVGFL